MKKVCDIVFVLLSFVGFLAINACEDGSLPKDCEYENNLEISFHWDSIQLSTDRWIADGGPSGYTMNNLSDVWNLSTEEIFYQDITRFVVVAAGHNCTDSTASSWVIHRKYPLHERYNVGNHWIYNTPQTTNAWFSTKIVVIAGVFWDNIDQEFGILSWTKEIPENSSGPHNHIMAGTFISMGRWSASTTLAELEIYYEDEFAEYDIQMPPPDNSGPA